MAQTFHFTDGDGEEHGPVSAADLKAAANDGRLKRDGKVRKEGGNWMPAGQVKGLFPDGHEQVQEAAGHVEKTAKTVSKVAKATGKVADAVSDVAEAGDKVQTAFTAVVGLSAGGSTLLGGVGDFLRPLGPVNFVVFAVALLAAVVLFVLARQRGANAKVKVRIRVKLGTVASLAVALVFGLWSGLGAVAGKGDKGVLATNIPAVERAQAAVLPVQQPAVVERPGEEEKVGEVCRFDVPAAFWSWTAFSPDGKRILYCGLSPSTKGNPKRENWLIEWDWRAGKEVRRVALPDARLHEASFSPDRTLLLLSPPSPKDPVRLWDVEAGRQLRRLALPGTSVTRAIFRPDGRQAVLGGGDALVLVDTGTDRQVRRFEGADVKDAHRLAVSPDGKLLYTSGIGPVARVWDVESGKFLREVTKGRGFTRPAFATDGRFVLDGGKGEVRLWDVQTGKAAGSFGGLEQFACAAFGNDGKLLVTAHTEPGAIGDLRVWDVAARKEVIRLRGHSSRGCEGIDVSPDGKYAVSSSQDGTVRVWRLPEAEGKQAAKGPVPEEGRKEAVWVALCEDLPRVMAHWRQGSPRGWMLHDPATKTLRIDNYFSLATVAWPGPWKELRLEIDASGLKRKEFTLNVGGTRLEVGDALAGKAGFSEVAIKPSEDGREVVALVGGREAARGKLRRSSGGEGLECELHCQSGPVERGHRNVVLVRNARVLVSPGGRIVPAWTPPVGGKEKGWMELSDTAERVKRHWKDPEKANSKDGKVAISASTYDAAAGTIRCEGYHSLGSFSADAPWKEFGVEVEVPKWRYKQLDLVVNGSTLALGEVLAARKGFVPVAVKFDRATGTLSAWIDGKVVQRATLTRPRRGEFAGFRCEVYSGFGEPSRRFKTDVYLRKARLLVLEAE